MSKEFPDACTCGHAREEHGGDTKYPGSTACNAEGCDCLGFEECEDEQAADDCEDEQAADDWEWWCRAEKFNLDKLAVKHRIVVKDVSRLLWLKSPGAIKVFDRDFGVAHRIMSSRGINWSEVAKEYAGIVIAPYQWSLRLDVMWYYTWDCASGCIWDTSIIAGVEPSLDREGEPT